MVTVKVPATTANLGPGFDTLGMALELYSEVTMEETPYGLEIEAAGEGAVLLSLGADNLVYTSAMAFFAQEDYAVKGLRIRIDNGIPLSRGLGSSAAAIVGGLLAARAVSGSAMSDDDLLFLASSLEGHPDNVAPALYGGLVLSRTKADEVLYRKIPVDGDITAVVAIPDFELSTKAARLVLPEAVPRADAIFNIGNVALMVCAFLTKDYALLGEAMEDRLHEPYRTPLVPGLNEVKRKARVAGAFSSALSGAGPTVIAFTDGAHSEAVRKAMEEGFQSAGIRSEVRILSIQNEGSVTLKEAGVDLTSSR